MILERDIREAIEALASAAFAEGQGRETGQSSDLAKALLFALIVFSIEATATGWPGRRSLDKLGGEP